MFVHRRLVEIFFLEFYSEIFEHSPLILGLKNQEIDTVRLFEIARQFPNPQRFAYEVSAGVTTSL